MKNIFDVINQKEAELQQLQKEIEALRLAARLLTDDSENRVAAAVGSSAPSRPATPAVKEAPQGGLRQFP